MKNITSPHTKAMAIQTSSVRATGSRHQMRALGGEMAMIVSPCCRMAGVGLCPTTLATLRRVEHDLPAHAPVPRQHVLVSVDPARDTVERLARYVAAFGPEFLGVTGSEGELSRLARDVGAAYFRGEPDDDGSYFVDHTASIMLVDPHGRLVALFGMPHDGAAIAARFLELEQAVRAAG